MSAMPSPSPGKRRSEQATSQARKRQRTEPDPESLRTRAKTLAHQLLQSLTDFLELFPDNGSTEADRWKIKFMQMACRAIINDMSLENRAITFEIDRETYFLHAHAHKAGPEMYEGIRNDVIQGASRLREVVVKYVEENKKQLEYAIAQEILLTHQTQLAPSTAALNDELLSAQTPNNPRAVYNGRPTELTGPCLSIYHPIFQEFMQAYNSPIEVDEITSLDCELANQLVCSSVKYFPEEDDRCRAILPCLEPYFGKHFIAHGRISSPHKHWIPGGHAKVECGLYKKGELGRKWMNKLILEIKNGIGIGDSDAVEQAQRDYVLVCTSPDANRLRDTSCMPAFLVGVAGPYMIVAGAIYLGAVVSATLTGYNSLTQAMPSAQLDRRFVNSRDQSVWHTAHTLRALRKCLDSLDAYYENMQAETGDVPSDILHLAPHFKEFQSENGRFTLTYRSHLLDDQLSPRSVFLADAAPKSDPESQIKCVVKFTERYGKEGHEIMAAAGVAPELVYCKWEATVGLWVVVTKYYESQVGAVPTQESIDQLREGLAALHQAGFVHGDIREANILVSKEGHAQLIDFDWSEQAGTARYPSLVNPKVKWVPEAKPGDLITSQHDTDMLGLYVSDMDERKLKKATIGVE